MKAELPPGDLSSRLVSKAYESTEYLSSLLQAFSYWGRRVPI